ncbi:MAG: TrkA C-terminal domain-containing protein [Candidatus Omnitrophota bacterium]
MVSLFLVIFIMILVTLLVEIAATALKLTGMDIHTARFQALSAITGTGFTTKETELVMKHRQRRGIMMGLMILGPICFIGMLSSLLISFRDQYQWLDLLAILAVVTIILLLTRNIRFVSFFHRQIERQLKRYKYPRKVQLEEVLQLGSDYGVYEWKVTPHSPLIHKQLQETDFRQRGFMVLAIKRGEELISVPGATDEILSEDVLVIFGEWKGLKTLADA